MFIHSMRLKTTLQIFLIRVTRDSIKVSIRLSILKIALTNHFRQFSRKLTREREETHPRTAVQAELLGGRVEDEELAPQVQIGGPVARMWHPRGGQPLQSASHDLPLSLAINPPPRPAGSPSRPASDRTDFAKTATSERSLGGSSTIYPRRSNKGDGGGNDAYNDLGSDLVELRDDVLPLMLLLAMFRLQRSAYVVLDIIVVVARSIQ